jgi:GTPase-associated system helical domain
VNTAIGRMAARYGKLGLETSQVLIESRAKAVEAASEEFGSDDLPGVLATAFALNCLDESMPLVDQFSAPDATFDVRRNQSEGALLAATLLLYEIQRGSDFSDPVSLILTTASFGGLRVPAADPEIITVASQALSNAQSAVAKVPQPRAYAKLGKTLVEAVSQLPDNGAIDASLLKPVLTDILKYCEGRALNAATSDNELLNYVKQLEEELRTYWWVVGRWSHLQQKPFRDLGPDIAAIIAGIELASKTTLKLGLYAAPALIDQVLVRDEDTASGQITLAAAATLLSQQYRKNQFGDLSESKIGPWLPFSTAMGLAALSNDEKDWEPRFKRITGINPKTKLKTMDLAIQIYRERLAAPLFGQNG